MNAPSSNGSADDHPPLPPLLFTVIGPLKLDNGWVVVVVVEDVLVVVVDDVDVVLLVDVVVLDFVVVVGCVVVVVVVAVGASATIWPDPTVVVPEPSFTE